MYEYPTLVYNLPASQEEFVQRFWATSCFSYATHATAMVCIDPTPQTQNTNECRVANVGLSGGQGAPVAITSVEEKASPTKVSFTINIHHNKQNTYDELYDYHSLYKCNPSNLEYAKSTDKNVVYVGYIKLSNSDITAGCTPSNRIRLDESGNGFITCIATLDGAAKNSYTTQLEMELWYGYSKSIYKDVRIKRI